MKKLLAALLAAALLIAFPAFAEETEDLFYELSEDGTVLTVRLDANPTTGYQWIASIDDANVLEQIGEEYVPYETDGRIAGAGGTYVADFKAAGAGETVLTLEYLRSWEEFSTVKTAELRLLADADGTLTVSEALLQDADSGDSDSGVDVVVSEDAAQFTVRLAANAGTGYEWRCDYDDALLALVSEGVLPEETEEPIDGGKITYAATFRAAAPDGGAIPGETLLTFTYACAWEEGEVPEDVLVFLVTIAGDGTLTVE